jgi:hypothetical protein
MTKYYGLSETARGSNPERPLTHLSDLTGRGLAVKATRVCSVDECGRTDRIVRGMCWAHYMRWWKYGDVGTSQIGSRGQPFDGSRHPNYRGSQVGYYGAHRRVRDERGPARGYRCAGCGGEACHWAYDHTDPAPLTDQGGLLYSADLARYKPLCAQCHGKFDLGRRSPRPPPSHCRRGHKLTQGNTAVRSDTGRARCLQCQNDSRAVRREQINARRRERRAAKKRVVI